MAFRIRWAPGNDPVVAPIIQGITIRNAAGDDLPYKTARLWNGEDAFYLIMTIPAGWWTYATIFERVYVQSSGNEDVFVIRNIEYDFARHLITVSCMNLEAWTGIHRQPRPPRFRTQQEADQWLDQHAPR